MRAGFSLVLVGGLLDTNRNADGHFLQYPTADYTVDGVLCESLNGNAA